ncbi:hypothetical protein Syn7803US83_68 [Synechococcus phage ACG-2014d]|uniref:Uncharacterized protein n=1 Tax=Synechococcus phage ACG-2014d TaxID=1493509 RepID=A0A0E3HXI5_9CAUD|nr:hypothetical protein Syn7803US83_68 [Synechococcus phage ACG-2014d]
MANSPNPDTVPSLMENDHGTIVLITDPRADIYLNKVSEKLRDDNRNVKKEAE